ncbi:hypothetical protein D0869_15042 [Hortaea werneckii]|uniref:Polyprenal reductase n=1 Tax=Hortaea werneckii TaxID=91943 RepID=A0A3M6XLR2_HORWE|nr:hypothetical protein D0869_15042 [Hortaea werneckii]RMX84780.1 hypothetical protein D0868_15429 [Hortaea werneckii]RMX91742.1 hypothetical protein D0867_14844 [Hortaea werneckii]RMY09785.1 hypothetical protein D0866_14572 [Hortaea werneckii]
MDLATSIRLTYTIASILVLTVYLLPSLRSRFLAYGPRTASPSSSSPPSSGTTSAEREKAAAARANQNPSPVTSLLDRLAEWKVPHSWFTSFYAVSIFWSLFWAVQFACKGWVLRVLVDWQLHHHAHQDEWQSRMVYSMTLRQVFLAWGMVFVQGCRRFWECLALPQSPSKSQMWIGHWVLGIGFYTGLSVAVWVEGAPLLASHTFSLADFAVPPPSFRTFLSLLLFILASGFQHDCHAYLCSLKSPASTPTSKDDNDSSSSSSSGKPKDSYKLPTHPAFTHLIVPHYTAECLLYLSLAFLAAPAPHPQSPTTAGARAQAAGRGSVFNYTLLSACIFVVVNLGVTAQGTREWYLVRFGGSPEGRELVERRWRLVPGVW